MFEATTHAAAALASLVTLVWRLRTDTKRYEPEWWTFVLGHLINVALQLVVGVGKL